MSLRQAAGIPEVAERLGHDPATLMRYYTGQRRPPSASRDHVADLIASDGVDAASRVVLDRRR